MSPELPHIIRPGWLFIIIPFVFAVIWFYRQYGRQSNWQRVVDSRLLPYLIQDAHENRRAWPIILLCLAGILSIIALAGPAWERIPQPVFRSDAATVIVLDLSRSMDAQDIKPSRLERARFKVADILKARQDGQTALIVYAADAFTVTPLTDDDETILLQLSALTTNLPPVQGSRADLALELATRLLKQASQTNGHILLMTDEMNRAQGIAAAQKLVAQGFRLSILGIGTEEGAPIPTQSGMLKNAQGEIVFARLNRSDLQDIASIGKGNFSLLTYDDSDLILLQLDEPAASNDTTDDLTTDRWKELGPWLLLPVLLLASLAFRRGILAIALVIILPLAQNAEAFQWQDLWQTPDQRGQVLFQQGQHQRATAQFTDPAWRGSSHYRSGNYEQALQDFKRVQGADARYNEGNTLAKLGKLEAAITAYENTLKENPNHEDAQHNKKLVEDLLKRQKQQRQNQPSENQSPDNQQSGQNQQSQDQSAAEPSDDGDQQNNQGTQQSQDQQKQSAGDLQNQQAQPAKSSGENEAGEKDSLQQAPDNHEQEQNHQAKHSSPLSITERGNEQQLAREQWLNRIPDNPAELLQRKFEHQYRQRARTNDRGNPW